MPTQEKSITKTDGYKGGRKQTNTQKPRAELKGLHKGKYNNTAGQLQGAGRESYSKFLKAFSLE